MNKNNKKTYYEKIHNLAKFIIDNNYNVKIENIGSPDKFVEHGSVDELCATIGMSDEQIADRIKKL